MARSRLNPRGLSSLMGYLDSEWVTTEEIGTARANLRALNMLNFDDKPVVFRGSNRKDVHIAKVKANG